MESTSVPPLSPDHQTQSGHVQQQQLQSQPQQSTSATNNNNNVLQQSQQPSQSLPSSPAYLLPTAASSTTTLNAMQQQQQPSMERLSRPLAFDKMELLVREMQDHECGVPVRSQKLFLTSIPSAFMGYDLIEWLMERLSIEESEALNISNQLCLHGYFFPVSDGKTLVVKDDSSLYRFQTPYYWPWQHKTPDNVDYAIYLVKRSLRNKQRHGLEDYEVDALASLHKNLKAKWDFITMQAEEQVKLSKDRKKGDKIVADSQERAFWRVHRPPPGQFTPLEPCPVPSRDRHGKPRRRTVEDCQREVDYLKASMGRTRIKMSQACEFLTQYWETFSDYDFFLQAALPSNPWVTEDTAFWQLNHSLVDVPTEKRVRRWAISIEELVSDATGLQEFTAYLKKEYSHENIRFWTAVNDLRRSAHSQISRKVRDIYEEFLEPGAPCEINIDSKTMEKVQVGLKSPTRFTFDAAAEHIYALLLKKDCYPRFIRSEHYKSLVATGIQPSHKKRFFVFGGAAKKKSSTTAPPNMALLSQAPSTSAGNAPGNLGRRRGSDRSLTGSAHELAVCGVKDASNKVPHSHSQSNLSEIPYSVVIYRGDMPSGDGNGKSTIASTIMEVPNVIASTATGVHNASSKTHPEGSKLLAEHPEAGPGSSAVCPWEDAPAPVSVSVCPWDDEDPPSTSKQTARSRNNSAFDSGSSSSDISEISDRMRRSCGLRQNTLDCDTYGAGKRGLAPAPSEPRRASITIAPRLCDLQFSFRQQSGPTTAATDHPPSDSVPKNAASIIATATKMPFSFLSQTVVQSTMCTVEVSQPTTATVAECANANVVRCDQTESKTQNTIEATAIGRDRSSIDATKVMAQCDEPVVSVEKCVPSISFSAAPTINVECDNDNENDDDDDDASDGSKTIDGRDKDKSSETIGDIDKSSETITPEICAASSSPMQLSLEVKRCDGSSDLPVDDLSPSMDEYQECCPSTVDYQYDALTGGEVLAPGCVPPAPTPAPSIAPLAEDEYYGGDDDTPVAGTDESIDEHGVAVSSSSDSTTAMAAKQSRTKKKKSREKCENESDKTTKSKEKNNRNAVCPWEDDENGTASSDGTFVKTYATLGYL